MVANGEWKASRKVWEDWQTKGFTDNFWGNEFNQLHSSFFQPKVC